MESSSRMMARLVTVGFFLGRTVQVQAASCYSDRVAYEFETPQCEYFPPAGIDDDLSASVDGSEEESQAGAGGGEGSSADGSGSDEEAEDVAPWLE